ncbi:MAG: hypothetical protein ABI669_10360 [Usitatibacter sp.]
MRHRKPQSLWDHIREWWDGDDDESEQAQDSTFQFDLLFAIPFAIVLLGTIRRFSGL